MIELSDDDAKALIVLLNFFKNRRELRRMAVCGQINEIITKLEARK